MAENVQSRRIRWGRCIGLSLLGLILALVIGHAFWGSIADRRLRSRIQALRDSGEPILPEDFAATGVDSPENGGIDVIEAALLLPPANERDSTREFATPALPLNEKERALLASMVPEYAQALRRLEPAFQKRSLIWKAELRSPFLGIEMDGREEFQELTSALVRQAIYDFDRGEHRHALVRLEQLILLSRYPDTYPSLLGHLVSIGAASRATAWLMEMSPELKVGQEVESIPVEGVQRMIRILLEDGTSTEGLARALRGERMANVDAMKSILNGLTFPVGSDPGRPWPAPLRYVARPVLRTNAVTMINHMNGLLAATDSKTLPEAKSRLPLPPSRSFLNTFPYMLLASNDRIFDSHFQCMTDRRLAAVSLAARWYATEHQGDMPATLERLVPRYLPRIPMDPMAVDEKPLRYLHREGKAIAWSIGTDGIDGEGSEAPIKPSHILGVGWFMKDRVIPLHRRPRQELAPGLDTLDTPPTTNGAGDLFGQ